MSLETSGFSEDMVQSIDQALVLVFAADGDAQIAARFQAGERVTFAYENGVFAHERAWDSGGGQAGWDTEQQKIGRAGKDLAAQPGKRRGETFTRAPVILAGVHGIVGVLQGLGKSVRRYRG